MKQLNLLSSLFVLLLCTCGPAQTGLQAQADIPASHPVDFISKFQDIHVATDGTGFVVGRCGVMRSTITDGQMWEAYDAPIAGDLNMVACPPAGCATALVQGNGEMFRLSNGSWTSVDSPNAAFDGNLHWLTADLVVHERGGQSYSRSTDGGLTWTELTLTDFQRANMVFLDEDKVIVWVGQELFKSTDGALSFTAVGYSHPVNVSKQAWLNDQEGWFFDADRLFHRTTDGGLTWTLLNAESQLTSVNWMEALSPTHLVGAQITTSRLESLDGGVTWARSSFLPEGNRRVNERYQRRGNEFFTVGDASQVMYSPAGFTDFVELDPFTRNARINQIAMATNEIGYASAGREILSTTDGMNWSIVFEQSDFARDLAVLDDGRPVILNTSSTKISDDGGATFTDWVPAGLAAQGNYGTVFSQKPNGDYYLLSFDFAFASTDDGATWAVVNHASELSYHGLFWITDDIGYAFTRQQHFVKTTDGGQTWTVGEGPARNLESIWFTDEMNGWVASANRRYVTADGGLTWGSQQDDGGYDYQLHPTDGSLLVARYLGGNNGAILRSTDDGETWRDLNFNCYAYRTGAVSPDGKYFWTGGDGGFIVRHDLENLIDIASGTDDVPGRSYVSLRAFPNPTDDLVTVAFPQLSTDATLQVFDLAGREVTRLAVPRGALQQDIDLSAQPAGVYVVRWLADGLAGRVKVVKR